MNCDCTETERRQHQEIEELHLTVEERASIEAAAIAFASEDNDIAAVLRHLLERHPSASSR